MEKNTAIILVGILAIIVLLSVGYVVAPGVRKAINENQAAVQIMDDQTNYKTLKKVEDTCRSMIASYESDVLTWEQYKDSEVAEERSWAAQAKMRANKTASSYNNYILQNNFVWKNNVPADIRETLELIE